MEQLKKKLRTDDDCEYVACLFLFKYFLNIAIPGWPDDLKNLELIQNLTTLDKSREKCRVISRNWQKFLNFCHVE